jgi:hypothetical protein
MNSSQAQLSPLLDERAVSSILNISVPTLCRWRILKVGPRFLKLSFAVRYRPEDIASFIDSRQVGGAQRNVA